MQCLVSLQSKYRQMCIPPVAGSTPSIWFLAWGKHSPNVLLRERLIPRAHVKEAPASCVWVTQLTIFLPFAQLLPWTQQRGGYKVILKAEWKRAFPTAILRFCFLEGPLQMAEGGLGTLGSPVALGSSSYTLILESFVPVHLSAWMCPFLPAPCSLHSGIFSSRKPSLTQTDVPSPLCPHQELASLPDVAMFLVPLQPFALPWFGSPFSPPISAPITGHGTRSVIDQRYMNVQF